MSEWLRLSVTVAMLAFVLVGYFTSAETAWRDLRALLGALRLLRRHVAPADSSVRAPGPVTHAAPGR